METQMTEITEPKKRRGRPCTRTGPAKRPAFADTGVKLGARRREWLMWIYGNYQRGICALIDAAMSAAPAQVKSPGPGAQAGE